MSAYHFSKHEYLCVGFESQCIFGTFWISCAPLLFFLGIVHPDEFLICSWNLLEIAFWYTVSEISIKQTTYKILLPSS